MRRTKGGENDFNAQLAKQQKDRILLEKDIAEVAGVFEVHRKLKSRRSKRKSPSWRLKKCYIVLYRTRIFTLPTPTAKLTPAKF